MLASGVDALLACHYRESKPESCVSYVEGQALKADLEACGYLECSSSTG
jgi:hypothetical protein